MKSTNMIHELQNAETCDTCTKTCKVLTKTKLNFMKGTNMYRSDQLHIVISISPCICKYVINFILSCSTISHF